MGTSEAMINLNRHEVGDLVYGGISGLGYISEITVLRNFNKSYKVVFFKDDTERSYNTFGTKDIVNMKMPLKSYIEKSRKRQVES